MSIKRLIGLVVLTLAVMALFLIVLPLVGKVMKEASPVQGVLVQQGDELDVAEPMLSATDDLVSLVPVEASQIEVSEPKDGPETKYQGPSGWPHTPEEVVH